MSAESRVCVLAEVRVLIGKFCKPPLLKVRQPAGLLVQMVSSCPAELCSGSGALVGFVNLYVFKLKDPNEMGFGYRGPWCVGIDCEVYFKMIFTTAEKY